jgi:CRISPR-associated protein Cas5t
MLCLYVQAPFAAFRTFTAGWYRPTAGFLTPSAAYGLLLNLAGIETRRDDGLSPMTVTRFGLPTLRIALGAVPDPRADDAHGAFPSVQTVYQQLHNYPVGASGKERKDEAHGNKYNITPVRREFLADLRACVCLDGDADLEDQVRAALSEQPLRSETRYGLPFLGDNAFLIDKIERRDAPMNAHWYRRLGPDEEGDTFPHTTRLTIWIDRQEMSRSVTGLYAPVMALSTAIPDDAWTAINPPPEPSGERPSKRRRTT